MLSRRFLITMALMGSLLPLGAPTVGAAVPADHRVIDFNSGAINKPIPDSGFVEDFVEVDVVGSVVDVDFGVRVTHSFVGDLEVGLSHRTGNSYPIFRQGSSGDNLGSGNADCTGTMTYFDDDAATSTTDGSPPWAGYYRPRDSDLLEEFNGLRADGPWRLAIFDQATGDTGTLHCWIMHLTIDTDTDDDGFTDAEELKLGSDRKDPLDPVEHHRSLSLNLKGHLKGAGLLTSDPSYGPCFKETRVKIQKMTVDGWSLVVAPFTDEVGHYVKPLPDKPGEYRAIAKKKVIDAKRVHICVPATSHSTGHEH
jgi:subtilisin-like proprotein convertase family protein